MPSYIKMNKYLSQKEGKGFMKIFGSFQCKVEPKETKEEAVVREIKEELGIDVSVEQYLTSIIDEREDCILHVHAYLCSFIDGDIHLHVHHESAWIDKKDVYQYTFEKADLPILDKLQEVSL